MSGYKTIFVTVEIPYVVPMIDGTRTEINGWTVDKVVADWFQHHNINSHHATRDSHRLGGGMKIIGTRTESHKRRDVNGRSCRGEGERAGRPSARRAFGSSMVNEHPLDVVREQAEDDGLWFAAELITEAYLQAALRRIHAAVEANEVNQT